MCKSFFDDVQIIIKSSETREINSLRKKWQDLRIVYSNNEQTNKINNTSHSRLQIDEINKKNAHQMPVMHQ